MQQRHKKPGRPLKGETKRVRTSFTLPPDQVKWLQLQARRMKSTKSDLLTKIIHETKIHEEVGSISRFKFPLAFETLSSFCKRHHIAKLSLFGSILTDYFGPESDIDILVEFEQGYTPGFLSLAGMELELTRLLGKKVDLRTASELSRYFRDEVIGEAQVLYAA